MPCSSIKFESRLDGPAQHGVCTPAAVPDSPVRSLPQTASCLFRTSTVDSAFAAIANTLVMVSNLRSLVRDGINGESGPVRQACRMCQYHRQHAADWQHCRNTLTLVICQSRTLQYQVIDRLLHTHNCHAAGTVRMVDGRRSNPYFQHLTQLGPRNFREQRLYTVDTCWRIGVE